MRGADGRDYPACEMARVWHSDGEDRIAVAKVTIERGGKDERITETTGPALLCGECVRRLADGTASLAISAAIRWQRHTTTITFEPSRPTS